MIIFTDVSAKLTASDFDVLTPSSISFQNGGSTFLLGGGIHLTDYVMVSWLRRRQHEYLSMLRNTAPKFSPENHLCTNIPTFLVLGSRQTGSTHLQRTRDKCLPLTSNRDGLTSLPQRQNYLPSVILLHLIYIPTLSKLHNFRLVEWELTAAVWQIGS
jgi:hypothetical protein